MAPEGPSGTAGYSGRSPETLRERDEAKFLRVSVIGGGGGREGVRGLDIKHADSGEDDVWQRCCTFA